MPTQCGVQIEQERHARALAPAPPAPDAEHAWIGLAGADGQPYYYNVLTHATQEAVPAAVMQPPPQSGEAEGRAGMRAPPAVGTRAPTLGVITASSTVLRAPAKCSKM